MPAVTCQLQSSRQHQVVACTHCQRWQPSGRVYSRTPRTSALLVQAGSSSKPLVVVGSVNADLVLAIQRLPDPGETISASTLNVYPGGKGANQAAAAGKLGYPTYFLGQVGQDAHAGLLRNALEDSGVDISCLRAVDGPSGSAVILLQPSGENSIIIVGGANMSQWELVDEGRQLLQSAGGILLQREIPEEVNIMVAQVAKEAGVPVLLDCGGMEGPISEDLLKLLSVLSPNETELARMTGKPTESDSEVEAAARQLLEQGVDTVLVKRGSQGSMLVTGRDNIKQPIFKVDKVIDTTGAGDCYTGAYSVAVLEGMEPAEALQFAAAAASVCIQRQGAMPSLPRREEVTSALQEPQ